MIPSKPRKSPFERRKISRAERGSGKKSAALKMDKKKEKEKKKK